MLLGSGGTADLIPELMKTLQAPDDDLVVYDSDPVQLIKRMVDILDAKYKDIHEQLLHDEHWYLRDNVMKSPPPRAG